MLFLQKGLNAEKIVLSRDRDRVEGTTQKNFRGQRQPFRGQTLSRARTQVQMFFKKENNNKVFKIFFQVFSKKQN